LLADIWARARGGRITALVVDHGLRAESAEEARLTVARLGARGIAARPLTIDTLAHGSALSERARTARYEILTRACVELGVVHLLLGHHAADQAETILIRAGAGSHAAGLAGMAACVETNDLRVLRPLLDIPKGRLVATLDAAGMTWVEDPSNANPRSTRARIRAGRADPDGDRPATAAMVAEAIERGVARASAERARAALLAQAVSFHPAGFAVVAAAALQADALAALIATVAGARRAIRTARLDTLAAGLRPATIGGVRIMPAGRLAGAAAGAKWLIVRERAALGPPVAAQRGGVWDGRWRLAADIAPGAEIGPIGGDAARFRRATRLPAAALWTLPAIRRGIALLAVPHLQDWPDAPGEQELGQGLVWCAALPASCAPFAPASTEC
jgi:tRNA(Ile)-lysidine synthase